jgi:hypothetical protein
MIKVAAKDGRLDTLAPKDFAWLAAGKGCSKESLFKIFERAKNEAAKPQGDPLDDPSAVRPPDSKFPEKFRGLKTGDLFIAQMGGGKVVYSTVYGAEIKPGGVIFRVASRDSRTQTSEDLRYAWSDFVTLKNNDLPLEPLDDQKLRDEFLKRIKAS